MSQFLRDYFHAGGDESGLPLEELQTQAYQDILRIRIFYDWTTDDLMEVSIQESIPLFAQPLPRNVSRTSKRLSRPCTLAELGARP